MGYPRRLRVRTARKFTATLLLLSLAAPLQAQTTLVDNLDLPLKITSAGHGVLLVSEGGTGPNTGKLTRVSTIDGASMPLVTGLPAGFDAFGRSTGPSDIAVLNHKRLVMLIGEGDTLRSGQQQGTTVPNPDGLSSPLLSSVLSIRFSKPYKQLQASFQFDLADHFLVGEGHTVLLANGAGELASIKLVSERRDITPDPNTIVRGSDPIGIAVKGKNVLVVNAATNQLTRSSLTNGKTRTEVYFDPIANPLPFGPPQLEAVPTSLRKYQSDVIAPLFSGFPYPTGASFVARISLPSFQAQPLITGLTTAIDALPIPNPSGSAGFLVVEYSTDILAQPAPEQGRLLHFATPGAQPIVLSDTLFTPTSVAYEASTGRTFVTESFAGKITEIP